METTHANDDLLCCYLMGFEQLLNLGSNFCFLNNYGVLDQPRL